MPFEVKNHEWEVVTGVAHRSLTPCGFICSAVCFSGLPLMAALPPLFPCLPLSPLACPCSERQQHTQSCKIKRWQRELEWPGSDSNSNAKEHRHQETGGPLCHRLPGSGGWRRPPPTAGGRGLFRARDGLQLSWISGLESEPFIVWSDSQKWLFLPTVSNSTVREV